MSTDDTTPAATEPPATLTNPKPRGTVLLRMAGPVAIFVDKQTGAFCTNVNGDLVFWDDVEAIDTYGRTMHAGPWVPAYHITNHAGDISAIVPVEITPIDAAGIYWLDRKTGKTLHRNQLVARTEATAGQLAALQEEHAALFRLKKDLDRKLGDWKHGPSPRIPGSAEALPFEPEEEGAA